MSSFNKKFMLTALISSAVILSACGISACSKLQSAESLVAEAKQYQQKGDHASALIQLKNALQKAPDNVEARYLLGIVENETGDSQSAEKELRKALSLGMSDEKVLPELAKSLLMQRQFQKVLDETEKVPALGDVPILRGNAFLGLGKTEQAKEEFELSLKNHPDSPDALIGLARNAILDKNIDLATSLIEHAVNKNPTNIEALVFKATLLRGQGDAESALSVFDKVLALKPDHAGAHLSKADIEIKAKKYDAAKADIDAARKAAPQNLMALYMQTVLDVDQGKNAEALEGVQKLLRVAPEYMPGVLVAGIVQYKLGSMQQAELYLGKYLEKNPSNLYARKLLASTLLKTKQESKAISVLAPALKESPQDVELLTLAGEAQMQHKDFTKATEYFESASKLAPQTAKLHTALGLSKLGSGQSADAITELEAATNLDTKSPQAGILLVMTHIRLKEFDKALIAANTLEKEQPGNPLVQNLKGGIYLGKNDTADARASFQKALSIQPTYFPAVANLAQLDLKDKKPDAAKKRFEGLLEADKKNIQAMNALAGLAISQKHPEEATVWLERASNDNPESLPAAMQLTMHYLKIGEKAKALTLARKLQVANPTNPDTLSLLAQTQLANDDQKAALESFERLASLLPNSAAVQLKIGAVQMALHNTSAASEAVKKALSLQPDNLNAEIAQASLYLGSGDQGQAMTIAKQMQRQSGQAAIGYELEADILRSQKKLELAAKAYEQAYSANKLNVRLLIKLHGALNAAGRGKDADSLMSQWLREHPEDTTARLYLADTYIAKKQNKSAIEQYQIVLRLQPDNVGALNNLAWAYQQEKNPNALETAEKAYRLAADSPPVLDTLGWMLVEQGNTARGLPLLQKASASAPTAPDIRYHLAQALLKSGDKSKARAELEQLLAAGKPFPQIDEAKALLSKM